MEKLIDLIIKKYRLVLAVIIIIALPLGYFSTQIGLNNNVEVFFNDDDPSIIIYKNFQKKYGNEEMVLLLFKDDNIFSNEVIEIIRKISTMAKKTRGIQRVLSITEHKEAVTHNDSLTFKKIMPEGHIGKQKLKTIREKILNDKALQQRIISKDGTTTAIMVELKQTKNAQQKAELMIKIRDSAKKIGGDRINLHFCGGPYYEAEVDVIVEKDLSTVSPLMGLMILIIALIMLKSAWLTLLCMCNLGVILMISVGFFAFCGETMNMVTNMLPSILMAIAIADSIHLLDHYKDAFKRNGNDHIGAVSSAAKAVWLPCLFTSLTTAVGFLSFVTSSIRPPKVLGIYTAIGVMFAFFMSVFYLPAILVFFRKRFEKPDLTKQNEQKKQTPAQPEESRFTEIMLQIGNFTTSHSKAIGFVFIILFIITIIGLSKMYYETNYLTFLPEDNIMNKDLKFTEENFGGAWVGEILIQAKSPDLDFTHPDSLKLVNEIQSDLANNFPKYVTTSFSIADYFKEMNKAFNDNRDEYYNIPAARSDVSDFYELLEPDDLEKVISFDKMEARISFQYGSITSNQEESNLYKEIGIYLKNKLGENYSFNETGQGLLFVTMSDNLQESFLNSFLFAFILIFIMMFFVCKNVKLTIISMVPNLFPIFATVGLMGLLDIPIDTMTVMIACITLGIAVDDTIHYLVWFRRNISSGMDIKSALIKTYKSVGKPIVITSAVLFLGFITLLLGSMHPIKMFGLFTAFAIFTALVSDFVLLPALILIFKPFGRELAPLQENTEYHSSEEPTAIL